MGKLFDKAPKFRGLTNPFKNGEKVKKVQRQQRETLQRDMGMKLPKSPV